MYELGIKAQFSAAHHLVDYPGTCVVHHGHNWDVEVWVRGRELDTLGLLLDFKTLKQAVNEVIAELDHTDLNAHAHFSHENPTSERIARYLYDRLGTCVNTPRYHIARVTVHETQGSQASYWDD